MKLQQISGTRLRKLKEVFVVGRFRTLRRGFNLLRKKTLCFVVIADGFRKTNPHLEA